MGRMWRTPLPLGAVRSPCPGTDFGLRSRMRRTWIGVAVFSIAAGCSAKDPEKKQQEQQQKQRKQPEPAQVDQSARMQQRDMALQKQEAAARKGVPAPLAAAPADIEVRTAKAAVEDLFAKKKARKGAAIVTGLRAAVEPDAEAGDDRLIIYRGKPGKRGHSTVQLVDLTSGKILASFGGLIDSSAAAGAISIPDEEYRATASIVRLADGQIVRAQPRLPDGKQAAKVQAVVRGSSLHGAGSANVWLFAQADDGSVYHGEWEDLNNQSPVLSEPFPFWPTGSGAIDRLEVWRVHGTPVGKGGGQAGRCVRMALGGGRPPTCRAIEPEVRVSAGEYMADGWSYFQGEVRNAYDETTLRLIDGCHVTRNASMSSPPRVLAACFNKAGGRDYVLWSPEKSWRFTEQGVGNSTRVIWGAIKPVFAMSHFWGDREDPNRRWLDAERGLITITEPLVPIGFALNGLERQFLATRPQTDPVEVVLVDLDANSVTTIARVGDCDGRLTVDNREGRRFALVCSKRTNPKYYRFDVRWTEVLDLDAKIRWRTRYFVDWFLSGGRIVASDKKRIAGETFAGGKRIFWLELGVTL